ARPLTGDLPMSIEWWKSFLEIGSVILLGLTFCFGGGVYLVTREITKRQEAKVREFETGIEQAKSENLGLALELEKEKSARLEIEGRVAWRRLDKLQQQALTNHLNRYSGVLAVVWFNSGDYEGALFTDDLVETFKASKWGVQGPTSKMDFMGAG